MSALRRRMLIALAGLGLVLVVLAGLATLALTTQTGLEWTLRRGLAELPGEASLRHAEGDLLGPVTIHGFRWSGPGGDLEVERVELEWRPFRLLTGRLLVDRLALRGVTITPEPTEETTGALPWPVLPALSPPGALPIHLDLRAVSVHDLALVGPETVRRVDRMSFRLEAEDARVAVSALAVEAPDVSLSGDLALGLDATTPSRGRIGWTARQAGDGWEGVSRLSGRWGRLVTEHRLTAPLTAAAAPKLTLELHDLAEAPVILGELRAEAVRLAELDPGLPALVLGGGLTLELGRRHLRLTGRVREDQHYPEGLGFHLGVEPGADADAPWRVTRLSLTPGTGGSLELVGNLEPDPGRPSLALEGAWQDLQLTLPDRALVSDRGEMSFSLDETAVGHIRVAGLVIPELLSLTEATLDASGGPSDYRASLRAEGLSTDTLPEATLAIEIAGDQDGLRVESGQLAMLGGTASFSGGLSWRAALTADADVRFQDLDPGRLREDLSGRLAGAGQLTVSRIEEATTAEGEAAGGRRIRVRLSSLSGQLNGHAVTGSGTLEHRPGSLALRQLSLELGPNRLRADGSIGRALGLDWSVDAPDLAGLGFGPGFGPGFGVGGHLAGEGRVSGSQDAPELTASLEAGALTWGEQRIEALQAELTGDLRSHRFRVSAAAAPGRVELAGAGGLSEGTWQAELTEALVEPAQAAPWRLRDTARLRVSTSEGIPEGAVEGLCLTGEHGAVCADASLEPDGERSRWDGQVTIEDLSLAATRDLLPPEWRMTGRVDGTLTFAGDDELRAARGGLRLRGVGLERRWEGEPLELLGEAGGEIGLVFGDDRLRLNSDLDFGPRGHLRGELALPMDGLRPRPDRPLRGRISAAIPDLGFASLFNRELGRVQGAATLEVEASGSLDAPRLVGDLRVTDGAASIPRLGIRITDISVDNRITHDHTQMVVEATSGEGRLHLEGRADFADGDITASMEVTGEGITVADLPEAHVRASPNLRIELDGERLDLSGQLAIPHARIRPPKGTGSVEVSPDEVIVGAEDAPPEQRYAYHGDLRLVLGDDVRFTGLGLDAAITGAIRITETPGEPTTASGQLDVVDGRYRALGQELSIQRGRLIYNGGPLENPGLDIRAIRQSGQVTAGVEVRGSLRRPRLTMFSDPPMPQSEVVSFLLTGKPMSQLGQDEQGAVSQAKDSLAIQGGSLLANQLGRRLGSADLSVETGETREDTAVYLGRYLSPRLYVSYGVGVFESFSSVKLRYQISEHLSLQTESGREDSADLIYSIERGLPPKKATPPEP